MSAADEQRALQILRDSGMISREGPSVEDLLEVVASVVRGFSEDRDPAAIHHDLLADLDRLGVLAEPDDEVSQ